MYEFNEYRVNTYVACLLITIIGSIAALTIIHVAYLTYAPPHFIGGSL